MCLLFDQFDLADRRHCAGFGWLGWDDCESERFRAELSQSFSDVKTKEDLVGARVLTGVVKIEYTGGLITFVGRLAGFDVQVNVVKLARLFVCLQVFENEVETFPGSKLRDARL